MDDNINRVLLDKIAAVNSLINSYDTTEPPYSFQLRYCEETVKQTRNVGYAMIGAAALMITRSLRPSASMRVASIIFGAAVLIFSIICIIYASTLDKNFLAEINGDGITVKGRTYNCSEISELRKASMNNLKVMSNGSKVIMVNKSCDGCADLVRWARMHNIPINDHSESSSDVLQKRNQTIAAVMTIACIFIALFIVLIKRMVM